MDVVFYAGLDDSQLNAKLARARSGVIKTLGGIPGQLSGAAGLASMIPGIGQIGAGFIAAGGAVYAYNRRLEEAAEKAREAGIEAVKAARDASRAFQGSLVGGTISAFGSERTQRQAEVINQISEMRAASEAQIAAELEAARKNRTDYDANVVRARNEEKIQQVREEMLADVDRQLELETRAEASRVRAAALAAQEAKAEADTVEELQKHAAALEKIAGIGRFDPAAATAMEADERARHAGRMDQIRAEELGRQSAAQEKLDRETEAAIAQEERARLIDLELDRQQALVDGERERADEIERQIAHERRLAEIKRLEVDEATRQMLIEKQMRLYGAGEPGRGGAPGTRAAGVGFVNQGALTMAALGGAGERPIEREQLNAIKTTNQKVDQLITAVKNQKNVAQYA